MTVYTYIYIHTYIYIYIIYIYIYYKINICERLQFDYINKLHDFFKNVLQNTRSMKTYASFQFSKQENHALYCNNI